MSSEPLAVQLARVQGRLEAREEEIERLRADYAALQRDMMAMKQEGFMPPPAQPQMSAVEAPPLPKPILEAAQAIADPGTPMYDAILEDARKTILELPDGEELDVEQLAAEIREGSTLNPKWF